MSEKLKVYVVLRNRVLYCEILGVFLHKRDAEVCEEESEGEIEIQEEEVIE